MLPPTVDNATTEPSTIDHLSDFLSDSDHETPAVQANYEDTQDTFTNDKFLVFDVQREQLATMCILKHCADNIPLHFRLTLRGTWRQTPLDSGDVIRVIATYTEESKYTVVVDDEGDNFVILDPDNGITCTQIVGSYPCVRRAVFQDQFRQTSVGYALVLGNILHSVFEQKVQQTDSIESDDLLIDNALRENFTQLYRVGISEKQVR